MESIHRIAGPFKPAADFLYGGRFQELKILGIAEEQRQLVRAPADYLSGPVGTERRDILTVEEQGYSSLTRNDGVQEVSSSLTPRPFRRSRSAFRDAFLRGVD